MKRLDAGDAFPSITVRTPDRGDIEVPDGLSGRYAAVLFFRGAWCPYCRAQLRAFERAADRLSKLDLVTVALSVDDEETTRRLIADDRIGFPVGHSADALALSEATGAFVHPEPRYLQSTGFVLGPDGRVIVSVYSSGAIGRLVPADVAGLVEYVREHAPA